VGINLRATSYILSVNSKLDYNAKLRRKFSSIFQIN